MEKVINWLVKIIETLKLDKLFKDLVTAWLIYNKGKTDQILNELKEIDKMRKQADEIRNRINSDDKFRKLLHKIYSRK